ncbi:MAG TPA: lytic transglycosylase domain-containing protein [Longimicrobium sp.]|nr:lytic transglycosylase domain-containing protein [Longimicrobium sp.]
MTTKPMDRPGSATLRRPACAALCALLVAGTVAPAGSQQGERAPRLAGVRVDSAQAQRAAERSFSGEFWAWLRDEARRFREMNGNPFTFALRYRISGDLAREIHQAAHEEGIDPELAFRLVRVESAFNPRARSPVGALGLTQLMPGTARWLDRSLTHRERILQPRTNLRVGFRYLRGLINKYDGDLRLALLAYNRGDGAVDRDLRRGRNPENGYTRKVLGTGYDRYSGSGLVTRQ